MRQIRLALFGILAGMALWSCEKEDSNAGTVALEASTQLNVSYGTDPLQKYDVYLPKGRSASATKAVVLIHGGSWIAGDKADFNPLVDTFKKYLPDYAIYNLNYRLAAYAFPAVNPWPTQINDVNAAMNDIFSKAAENQVNGGKTVLLGASAGAQLALIRGNAFNQNGQVKAIVNLFGPTDLADLYNNPPNPQYQQLLTLFMSGTPSSAPANYASASPLTMINASDPPTITFHGTADATVPVRQSDSLHARLQRSGVANEYYRYPGLDHGNWPATTFADTYSKSIAFMLRYNP